MGDVSSRPVDIEIVPRAHAILSASSAERWLVCTPSARIEEALPDRGSSFSTDGTAAHAFAELRLRYLLKQIAKAEYLKGYEATKTLYAEPVAEWTHADWDAIDAYVDYVMAEVSRLTDGDPDAQVLIEARVDYSKYAEGGFGTSDVIIVAPALGIIKSIDLKFGKGVPVNAMNNPQAKLYALGAALGLDPKVRKRIKEVEWAIAQPRLDDVPSEDSMSAAELIEWAETVVAPAAELAWAGKGDLKPTAKGCRFCKAAPRCRARAAENVLIARRDFAVDSTKPDPRLDERLMDMDEVARILPDIDAWIQWANSLKAYALEAVRDRNETIPGYKLVRGRANRAWAPGADLPTALKAAGVSETDIFVSPEPSVRSVAQLEKQIGKGAFAPIEKALVVKPLGTPALVPDTDPREAVNRLAEATAAFADE